MAIAVAPARTQMSQWAQTIYRNKYEYEGEGWEGTADRVATHVLGALGYGSGSEEVYEVAKMIRERKFLPGGRYLSNAGRPLHQVNNCFLLSVEDTREGWAKLMHNICMALSTGGGIGVDYSLLRERNAPLVRTGGVATGPTALMQMVNEAGRGIIQGGSRRSAIWAGLNWNHPDVEEFIRIKDWSSDLRALKEKDVMFPAPMELTNVSVELDDLFFEAFDDINHDLHDRAREIYGKVLEKMLRTGEPGFSIDRGINAGENLRNACTEVTSADDSDVCNLGSINLARVRDVDELEKIVDLSTLFLLAGTVYSHLPYEGVRETRDRNRRLGLGLMGMHEWLLQREKPYGADAELQTWLETYEDSTERAWAHADEHSLSRPVKTRAIAPTGTISIIAETTSGIEPIFCAAFKRRYFDSGVWRHQYVIDPTARRLVDEGVDPDSIEDAYQLSYDVERRVAFQAWVQEYVDHGISSTINLPYPIEDADEVDGFGEMLMKYLPNLRGITTYPDGSRGAQPLSAVPYKTAITKEGRVFEENEASCSGSVCGS